MQPISPTNGPQWRELVRVIVFAGIATIALLDLVQEALTSLRRAGRVVDTWWAREERRQASHVHKAEVDFLARVIRSASGGGR
jgi:hypothetical protein